MSSFIDDELGIELTESDTPAVRSATRPTLRPMARPTMSDVISNGIDDGSVYIAFQPIVDFQLHQVFGYEALVRSTLEGLTSPLELIGAACGDGSMGKVGRMLRRLAVDGCPDFVLFLNLHPAEFAQPWLVRPDDAMVEHDHDIYLEVTESVPLSHYEHCHSVLKEIRSRGVRIAIDDLGAGYSNLKYIIDLDPDIVKLDRELIKEIRRDSRQHRLVTSLVEMCTCLGAEVVAEGIETHDELIAVIDTGARFGQGYFLGRPNPVLSGFNWKRLISGRIGSL